MRLLDFMTIEWKILLSVFFFASSLSTVNANTGGNVLGCGGFIKSHSPIDFTKIEVKLYTKTGTLKDNTFCAPNNGYYFLPLYEKGEYLLQIHPPTGWSFVPKEVKLLIDGSTDPCSQGKDVNFVFAGFGITGQVENINGDRGPKGVKVGLSGNSEIRETITDEGGKFFFTPVYPGTYTVTASHSKWKLKNDKYTVQVATGNTELPKGTFLISGYDVRGSVTFERRAIPNILFMLYNDSDQPVFAENCNTEKHPDIPSTEDYICCEKSNEIGVFEFPTLSPGSYKLKPVFKGKNIKYHIHPEEMKFRVVRDSLTLSQTFEVRSFTISGRVLVNTDGNNVQGATIFVNDKPVTTTRSDGSFVLKKLNAGSANIYIESPGLKFVKKTIKISPYIEVDSDFLPLAFQICGNVVSENVHTVVFRTLETKTEMHVYETESNKETGDFCTFLPPGKYTAGVISDVADVQFFPVSQFVQVISAPVSDINFSQLKASVTGNVKCIQPEDCAALTVTITQITHDGNVLDKTNIVSVKDGLFMFSDVIPGTYEVTLGVNKFCWKAVKHVILVNSEIVDVPDFVQTGYKIIFLSSHNVQVQYQSIGTEFEQQRALKTIQLIAGQNTHCLANPGTYEFKINSCHIHENSVLKFSTNTDTLEIILTATKHKVSVEIMSFERSDSLNASVTIGTVTNVVGPLIPKSRDNAYYYEVSINLSEHEEALIVPHSEILWFKPTSLVLIGENDCVNHGPRIMGLKGRVIKGTVLPALEGVKITVIGPGQEEYVQETDGSGKFQFPTLDDSHNYKVSASKLSYIFTGPDDQGNFKAHKLAEIIVISVDETDNSPLQGTLISLSGGESYRSNLQTGANGTINFMSLQPNEYFLKPMMKEYNFEPSSKIVQLAEGAKVVVKLSGKRVAYSVYGLINSLSGEPEHKMIVIAAGTDSCSQYNEEAMSEEKGQFRVRGLHPHCIYQINVKEGVDSAQKIERVIPDSISLQTNNKDINDVKLITLRYAQHMDLIVQILSSKPEYFRTLRLKICKEAFPNLPIYNIKLDSYVPKTITKSQSGILIHLPPVAMDGKSYFLQLESTLSQAVYSYKTDTEHFIANTSFKSFTLKFDSKSQENDQDMVQTSVFALPVFLLCLVAMYHIQYIINFVSELVQKHNLFANIYLRPKSPVPTRPLENSDIDQIVQNINTVKRKVRPRKV